MGANSIVHEPWQLSIIIAQWGLFRPIFLRIILGFLRNFFGSHPHLHRQFPHYKFKTFKFLLRIPYPFQPVKNKVVFLGILLNSGIAKKYNPSS